MPNQLLSLRLTGANGYELERKRWLRYVKRIDNIIQERTKMYFDLRKRFPDWLPPPVEHPTHKDIEVYLSKESVILFPSFSVFIDDIRVIRGIEEIWIKDISNQPKCTAISCATKWGEEGESVALFLSRHAKGLMSETCTIGEEQNLPIEKAQLIADITGRPQVSLRIKALWDNATSARQLADDLSRLLGLLLFSEKLLTSDLLYLDECYEYQDIYRPTEKGLEIYDNNHIDEPLAPPKRKRRTT